MMIAARKGSPLVLGLKDNEFFIASDISPIIKHELSKSITINPFQKLFWDDLVGVDVGFDHNRIRPVIQ